MISGEARRITYSERLVVPFAPELIQTRRQPRLPQDLWPFLVKVDAGSDRHQRRHVRHTCHPLVDRHRDIQSP